MLNVDDKDKLCVQIAALVHDLGHGPFSHQFEHVLHEYGRQLEASEESKCAQKAEILKKWTHEEQSIKMFGTDLRVHRKYAWQIMLALV